MSHSMVTAKSSRVVRALCVISSRPELVKMAPIVRRMEAEDSGFSVHVVLAEPPRSQLLQVARSFEVTAHSHFDLPDAGATSLLLATLLSKLDTELGLIQPDVVIAQGDGLSALACALSSHHRRVRFVHVEAGVQSSQHPHGQVKRSMISALTDLHCAPTAAARAALLAQNVKPERVIVSGDTAVDSLLDTVRKPLSLPVVLAPKQRLALLSLHRRAVCGAPAERIFRTVRHLAARNPDVDFVHPVHPDPAVRRAAYRALSGFANIRLIEPVDYPGLVALLARASVVLTDSSGIQEVAPSLNVPTLILRDQVERPEGVAAGCATLVGTEPDAIFTETQEILNAARANRPRQVIANPFGDGNASQRILYQIRKLCQGARVRSVPMQASLRALSA